MRTVTIILLFITTLVSCQTDEVSNDREEGVDIIQSDSTINGLLVDSLNVAISNASRLPNFYGLMVTKDGDVVLERYFKGKDANTKFHLRSITKNITSALAGIAIE